MNPGPATLTSTTPAALASRTLTSRSAICLAGWPRRPASTRAAFVAKSPC